MNLAPLALLAFLASSCQTGQSVSEFLTPDRLEVGGFVGASDTDGSFSRRAVPMGWEGTSYGGLLTLGWDLTAHDVTALREAVSQLRALRELAERPPARPAQAPRRPGRCESDPPPADKPAEKSHVPPATAAPGLIDREFGAEELVGSIGMLAMAVATYVFRERIPGVRRIKLPRGKRAAKPPTSAGG